jgi:cell division septum initiation protein DivIVA
LTVHDALEKIYESLANDNVELDAAIKDLKTALTEEGLKEAVVEPARLAQNNRQGRKLMQSYFKKKGVTVTFAG